MRITLALLFVVTVFLPSNVYGDLHSGLIAFYPFNGNAEDESRNDNDGSVQGPTLTEDRNGQPNSAYHFGGGSDVIEVLDSPSLDIEHAASFTAWIRPEVTSGIHVLFRHNSAVNGGRLFNLDIFPGTLRCGLEKPLGGEATIEGDTAIQQGIWQHLAVTWDGSIMRAYYNGQPDGTSEFNGPMMVSDGKLWIGRYYGAFQGDIDEIRIYDRALSESEISELLEYENVYWIDNAAHLPGQFGSQWRTDIVALNEGNDTASVKFRLHSPDGIKELRGSIAPAEQGAFEDIVGLMGYSGKGCLEIQSDQSLQVSGRIFNQADDGTFGQFTQAYRFGSGLSLGESTLLLQLRQQEEVYRTNISVANTGSAPAEVDVVLFDRMGNELTTYVLKLDPAELIQDTEPFKNRANSANLGWGYAKVTVKSGFGILVSASVIDSITNDATTIPMN